MCTASYSFMQFLFFHVHIEPDICFDKKFKDLTFHCDHLALKFDVGV